MSPQAQGSVQAAQDWLRSSWHVQVPSAWLEACVAWLQEEAGGRPLSQRQLNQQVLDQWLLTDLRDLAHPVLPAGLSQAQKTELSGTFCLQVDSLLDVSQPAYGQLQRWRGADCANEGVSAVTQATQRPWEAKPTRVLLLQLTDGVQSLEGMEYRPIPALDAAAVKPGAKLRLQGRVACRLGVLLLGPGDVTVLGGEVEELAERNSRGRVLCRALGLPEEEPAPGGAGQQEDPPPPGGREEAELDDQELLASLEAEEERQGGGGRRPQPSLESSGYGTLSDTSSVSSWSGSLQSHGPGSAPLGGGVIPPQGRRRDNPAVPEPGGGAADDFPDEDFDDLPLDELDSVIFQESSAGPAPAQPARAMSPDAMMSPGDHFDSFDEANDFLDERDDFPDEDMDCLVPPEPERPREEEPPARTASSLNTHQNQNQGASSLNTHQNQNQGASSLNTLQNQGASSLNTHQNQGASSLNTHQNQGASSLTPRGPEPGPQASGLARPALCNLKKSKPLDRGSATVKTEPENEGSVTLDSPPFTYICLLPDPDPGRGATSSASAPPVSSVRVKAFIVTLMGKLQSAGGEWRVGATISDGTGYLDVALSDGVLTGLLGFSVARKAAMKRDPALRAETAAGMRACQEGLVDMCCVMTLELGGGGGAAVVTRTDDVTAEDCRALEERVTGRRGR